MSPSLAIPIHPAVLQFAREESGFSIDRVAKRLAVEEERVLAWALIDDPARVRRHESLARHHIKERYSWDCVVDALEGVYRGLLGQRRGS